MRTKESVGTAVVPARSHASLATLQGRDLSESGNVDLTVRAFDYLKRASAQLQSARNAEFPADRFLHSHFAALRTAGALVDHDALKRSRRHETFWQALSREHPSMAQWAIVFEESASLRVDVENGDESALAEGRADFWLEQASQFFNASVALFGIDAKI